MKTLFASTAIAMALAVPATAQDAATGPFVSAIEGDSVRGSDLMGSRLYVSETEVDITAGQGQDWNDVGEISDIVLGNSGEIDAVLVDIGGFLGIGERTVAVNMDDLQFVSDGEAASDYFIVMQGTQEDLENAPEFQEPTSAAGLETGAMNATQGTGMDTQAGSTLVTGGNSDPSMDPEESALIADGMEPEEARDAVNMAETEAEGAVEDAGAEMAEAGDEAEATLENVETELAEAGGEAETAMENAGDEMAEAGNEVEATVDETATEMTGGETEMAQDDATMAPEGDMAAAGTAGLMPAPMMEREGYQVIGYDQLTADDVTGAAVYGPEDERVGEIGELLVSDDGKLDSAIVDVGGFLGLGEKQVEVPFDNLQILQGENDMRIYIDATEEQLEQLPAYEG
ncbi:PRC-barrel domain-containing protein [uncultured Jannaschia sp.]|uniref:PRC-barrel domain-containing protein n=1 Tax=uncultured Jannaschia sp. TaxID=293347 RepID=UPI00260D5549|nr:PRC-barrel domain-containing protein [uncultured Jannaschia sp.]